jgi:hypothetical protein
LAKEKGEEPSEDQIRGINISLDRVGHFCKVAIPQP